MIKKIIAIILVGPLFAGCSKFLDKKPFASLTPDQAFGNANDMALYVNSFYVDQMPNASDIATGDNLSDYISGNNVATLLSPSTNPNNVSGWSWTTLRNINYFLDNYNMNPAIAQETRNAFGGIAKYFRAMFYFNMLKQYGDVPWYGHALAADDSALQKPRDPRTLIMDSIVSDLDFAIANVPAGKDETCSTITRWVALALKSRVCLFEGTFRKYHPELNLSATAGDLLQKSLDASRTIVDSGAYSLHATGHPESDYRDLFTTQAPWSDEVILAAVYSDALKNWSSLNQYFTSQTLGFRSSVNKQFIDTYLNADGSRFTDQPGFDSIFFVREMMGRDARLAQTVRCNSYKRASGKSAPPDYAYTYTGYQILKYTLDDQNLDYKGQNNNSIPVFRYAEILLNMAEAEAELGSLTPEVWEKTIGALRTRAGITNTSAPSIADPYLRTTYFPEISDAALLEIRRERGTELFCEGLRFDDIRRWKAGHLMSMPYLGVYVPAMDTPYAMNGDGVLNVSFVNKKPADPIPGVIYYIVNGTFVTLTEGTRGNVHWLANYDADRKWTDKLYYYPIPTGELVLNPNLTQSPGW